MISKGKVSQVAWGTRVLQAFVEAHPGARVLRDRDGDLVAYATKSLGRVELVRVTPSGEVRIESRQGEVLDAWELSPSQARYTGTGQGYRALPWWALDLLFEGGQEEEE